VQQFDSIVALVWGRNSRHAVCKEEREKSANISPVASCSVSALVLNFSFWQTMLRFPFVLKHFTLPVKLEGSFYFFLSRDSINHGIS